jgi:hypothetical protein
MSKKAKETGLVINGIEELENIYFFINPDRIKYFLDQHTFLYPILFEAKDKIYKIFGKEVKKLCLELILDPEDGSKDLFIIIKTNLSAEDAIKYENRLSEDWFLYKFVEIKGLLNFTEESL